MATKLNKKARKKLFGVVESTETCDVSSFHITPVPGDVSFNVDETLGEREHLARTNETFQIEDGDAGVAAVNNTYVVGEDSMVAPDTTVHSPREEEEDDDDEEEELSGAQQVEWVEVVVLHCASCCRVLGDSLAVCGEVERLSCIISLRVTNNVMVNDNLEFGLQDWLTGCAYYGLRCAGCRGVVGLVLYSSPPKLSELRGLFLLQKERIVCYVLKSSTMVTAVNVCFNNIMLGEDISQLKKRLLAINHRLMVVEEKLSRALKKVP
nr:PREDICTED: protein Mis18-beta-like [Lepisosteus oculatus]